MASFNQAASAPPPLPPRLLDLMTILSLFATVAIVGVAYATSRRVLPVASATPPALRFLFIWHLADALCHFLPEDSFLYHCFFSYIVPAHAHASHLDLAALFPTPFNFLGNENGRIYGPQAGGKNPFSQLWMVYARADRRWAGADLSIISLELLTVFFCGPLACYICYLIARRNSRASIWMIVLATSELYGGFMTFCPEWLTGNLNLDSSNFLYLRVYRIFVNTLWVFIPLFAIFYSINDISHAFTVRGKKARLGRRIADAGQSGHASLVLEQESNTNRLNNYVEYLRCIDGTKANCSDPLRPLQRPVLPT